MPRERRPAVAKLNMIFLTSITCAFLSKTNRHVGPILNHSVVAVKIVSDTYLAILIGLLLFPFFYSDSVSLTIL